MWDIRDKLFVLAMFFVVLTVAIGFPVALIWGDASLMFVGMGISAALGVAFSLSAVIDVFKE